ncbi:MAG: hypothetical protein MUP80_07925, partial [Acidobacteriia bacterium]|nr:hypothetical protein [Terriglobia bacterium]
RSRYHAGFDNGHKSPAMSIFRSRDDLAREKPLPHGWRWVRLGEVAEYLNGRAFKPEEWGKSGLPIIRI